MHLAHGAQHVILLRQCWEALPHPLVLAGIEDLVLLGGREEGGCGGQRLGRIEAGIAVSQVGLGVVVKD